jgi:hypothetical protein
MTDDVAFPAPPTTLAEARAFLSWVADAALRSIITKDAALGATKACSEWCRVENYSKAIADLRRQVTHLQKTVKST